MAANAVRKSKEDEFGESVPITPEIKEKNKTTNTYIPCPILFFVSCIVIKITYSFVIQSGDLVFDFLSFLLREDILLIQHPFR